MVAKSVSSENSSGNINSAVLSAFNRFSLFDFVTSSSVSITLMNLVKKTLSILYFYWFMHSPTHIERCPMKKIFNQLLNRNHSVLYLLQPVLLAL